MYVLVYIHIYDICMYINVYTIYTWKIFAIESKQSIFPSVENRNEPPPKLGDSINFMMWRTSATFGWKMQQKAPSSFQLTFPSAISNFVCTNSVNLNNTVVKVWVCTVFRVRWVTPTRVTCISASKQIQIITFFTKHPGQYNPGQLARSSNSHIP